MDRLVRSCAADEYLLRSQFLDRRRRDAGWVIRKNYKVRQLPDLQRADVLLAMGRIGAAQAVGAQRFLRAKQLLSRPFMSIDGTGKRRKRVELFHRAVAGKCNGNSRLQH